MSRNVRAAATALALAGGVYLAGPAPAEASNMGFKLERNFDLIRRASDNRPLQNIYYVSFPYFNGVGDVANTAATQTNKCVGDATGPAAPDGIINSDDEVCELWQARIDPATAGTFTFTYIDRSTCTPVSRIGTVAVGRVNFTGVPFALQPDIGYQVRITASGTLSPQNRGVIVGSHDPSFTGRTITFTPDCAAGQTTNCCGPRAPRIDMPNLPYHTMYQTSYEYLCGLETVDWQDTNGDNVPDNCWDDANGDGVFNAGDSTTGVFDGRVAMTVDKWDNTEAVNGPVSHTATIQLGRLRFTGLAFDLVPGDAYLLRITRGHSDTTFLSPHF